MSIIALFYTSGLVKICKKNNRRTILDPEIRDLRQFGGYFFLQIFIEPEV